MHFSVLCNRRIIGKSNFTYQDFTKVATCKISNIAQSNKDLSFNIHMGRYLREMFYAKIVDTKVIEKVMERIFSQSLNFPSYLGGKFYQTMTVIGLRVGLARRFSQ